MLNLNLIDRHRRGWEWRVCDASGIVLSRGREKTRIAARYRGYQAMFVILAKGTWLIETGPLSP